MFWWRSFYFLKYDEISDDEISDDEISDDEISASFHDYQKFLTTKFLFSRIRRNFWRRNFCFLEYDEISDDEISASLHFHLMRGKDWSSPTSRCHLPTLYEWTHNFDSSSALKEPAGKGQSWGPAQGTKVYLGKIFSQNPKKTKGTLSDSQKLLFYLVTVTKTREGFCAMFLFEKLVSQCWKTPKGLLCCFRLQFRLMKLIFIMHESCTKSVRDTVTEEKNLSLLWSSNYCWICRLKHDR